MTENKSKKLNKEHTNDIFWWSVFTTMQTGILWHLVSSGPSWIMNIALVFAAITIFLSVSYSISLSEFITDNYPSNYSWISSMPITIKGAFALTNGTLWCMYGFPILGVILFISASFNMFVHHEKLKFHKKMGWIE